MFSASGENTQIALTNIVWLLVRTPSAAARLRQELDDVYAARGLSLVSLPIYEMVKDLAGSSHIYRRSYSFVAISPRWTTPYYAYLLQQYVRSDSAQVKALVIT